jgi:hypothetical protein
MITYHAIRFIALCYVAPWLDRLADRLERLADRLESLDDDDDDDDDDDEGGYPANAWT